MGGKTTCYTSEELAEALRAINSIIHKCEKAQEKFPQGNSHHTLLRNRLQAMYISQALITEKLVEMPSVPKQLLPKCEECSAEMLLSHLDMLHTTDLGVERIKANLNLHTEDVIAWCMERIRASNSIITRKGKNWYIAVDNIEITVNAHSYTIITAHSKQMK